MLSKSPPESHHGSFFSFRISHLQSVLRSIRLSEPEKKVFRFAAMGRCRKHPGGSGGTSFLRGVKSIFMIFRGRGSVVGVGEVSNV